MIDKKTTDKLLSLPTPFYFYDMAILSETLRLVKTEAEENGFSVHYAVKANFNPVIMSTIAATGMGADCVSGNEIEHAISCGFSAGDVVFAGVGKSDNEIETALRAGIQAEMTSSDLLVLLSDVDGLYDGDPTHNPAARLIPEVRELTPAIEALAGDSATEFGSGGMITKLIAARICMNAGCATVIASGKRLYPLKAIEEGANCTWFLPGRTPRQARKQWIAGTLVPRGTLTVDEGAEQALRAGSSLLPVGIVAISGDFQSGDAVTIRSRAGRDLGRGLVAYSSEEARRILGRRSDELPALLGYSGRDELIHRDNLALLDA